MHTDVVIIGAGTAGLAAASEVKKQTKAFLLIDPGPLGTTCARNGCMPSKLLIEAANAYHRRHSLSAFGIHHADALTVDMPAVMARVRQLRDFYVDSTLEAIEQYDEHLLRAKATLWGPDKVKADDEVIHCDKVIIATGSRPAIPASWQALKPRLLSSDEVFEQHQFEKRIAVVGLGAIGLELAQALSRLGHQVTAYGSSDRLATLSDDSVNTALLSRLQNEFSIHSGHKVELEACEDGIRVVDEEKGEVFGQVIAATGRQPNVDTLGLETLGVPLNEQGLPEVDPYTLQIVGCPVFIAGDSAGKDMLLHEAADEGRIAGHNAVSSTVDEFCRRTPMHIVFTDPQIALIGQHKTALPADSFVQGSADFSKQGRARAAQVNYGLLMVYADKGTGTLLGAEMAIPAAEHIGHTLALAIQQQLTVTEMLAMPIYHPVLEEGMRTALRELQTQLASGERFTLSRCDKLDSEALD
jgi:dihydrolipoamide dehydrogenase